MHQSHKSLWSWVIDLVLLAPASWYQYAQQQDDGVYKENACGLGDGDVERQNLFPIHFFHYLVGIVLRITILNNQVVWTWTVAVGISLLRELSAGEHMPSCGRMNDDWQIDHDRIVAHLGDMPFIRILDMTPQYLLYVDVFLRTHLHWG